MNTQTEPITVANVQETPYSACLLFSANALARAITAIGDAEFGKLGLSYSHAYLLHEVVNQPGITPSQLSNMLFLTPSTITRLVEKLEQKQLVWRESEGKKTLVYPSEAGRALRPAIAEAWQRTGEQYARAIGPENVCAFTEQVFKAARALGDGA